MDNAPHPPILLETPRLVLRGQSAADIPALLDLWTDPLATRYLGGPRDRDSLQAVFAETARDPRAEAYDLWPVVEKAAGRLVGHCGLLAKEVDGRAEIEVVYLFAPAAWGQGYATEMAAAISRWALERLGLRRLIALIEPENAASERVAVKIGMRLEKETVRPGGARRKVYVLEAAAARPPVFFKRLDELQPSQLYVSAAKLAQVRRDFDPRRPASLEPIPIKALDGRLVMTDGHTRALAAFLAGLAEVPVVWEEDELDWEAYRICVGWCLDEGIRGAADLRDRVVPAAEYEVVWHDRCAEMQRGLAARAG